MITLNSPLQPIWDHDLSARYMEPWRFYHKREHIKQMFGAYRYFYNEVPATYEMIAILYHDAIYKPGESTNEEDSIQLMYMHYKHEWYHLFGKKIALEDIEKAEQCILASKHADGIEFNQDVNRFLDCDLSILGSVNKIYREYSNNIRREYSMYPDEIYYSGRINVLKGFLNKRKIYLTFEAQEVLERQAKDNIAIEIEECQKKLIDLS